MIILILINIGLAVNRKDWNMEMGGHRVMMANEHNNSYEKVKTFTYFTILLDKCWIYSGGYKM